MMLVILAGMVVAMLFQSILIVFLTRKLARCIANVETHDVSIRRLNHRVIGEQYPVKTAGLPPKLL